MWFFTVRPFIKSVVKTVEAGNYDLMVNFGDKMRGSYSEAYLDVRVPVSAEEKYTILSIIYYPYHLISVRIPDNKVNHNVVSGTVRLTWGERRVLKKLVNWCVRREVEESQVKAEKYIEQELGR